MSRALSTKLFLSLAFFFIAMLPAFALASCYGQGGYESSYESYYQGYYQGYYQSYYQGSYTSTSGGMTQVVLLSGSTWQVPSDWVSANNTIEAIGGGAGGGVSTWMQSGAGGGGGGGYSKKINVTLTPGATLSYGIGAGGSSGANGGDTHLCSVNASGSCDPAMMHLRAKGGTTGGNGYAGAGGAAASGIGSVKYSGGAGGNPALHGGGGGGAAGLNGDGVAGAYLTGGAGDNGSGGAGGAFQAVGGVGTEWTSYGSGGGGGAGAYPAGTGAAGGLYGSGGGGGGEAVPAWGANGYGGAGKQGIIVIRYGAATPSCSVTVDANPIAYGGTTTLRWTSSNVTTLYIANVGYVTPNTSGSTSVGPLATTAYNGTAVGAGGTVNCNVTLTVTPAPPSGLSASCNAAGNRVTLSWNAVSGADTYGPRITVPNASMCPSSGWQLWTDGSTCYPNPDGWNSTSITDFAVTPSTSYDWWVHAVDNVDGWGTPASSSFTCAPAAPTCVVSVNPTTVAQGSPSTLTWSSSNATSCTGSNFTTSGATSGSVSVSPSTPTTYTASCTGAGGTTQCSGTGSGGVGAALSMSCTQSWSCTGTGSQTITRTNTDCSTTDIATCSSPQFCTTGSSSCIYNSITGSITASPRIIASGATASIAWSTSNAVACTVTGNGDTWTGTSGTHTSSAITAVSRYTLVCDDGDPDSTQDDYSRAVTVVRVPSWLEI